MALNITTSSESSDSIAVSRSAATRSSQARELAGFALSAKLEDLSPRRLDALKIRVLDGLGCALGALAVERRAGAAEEDHPTRQVRAYVEAMGGAPRSTLFGGGRSSPPLAALYDGYLVRYLDYNDSYLAPGETCHPSDNLAPLLAVAEDAGADGAELLVALAVAYQVQCRLSDVAPVRDQGFDHTVQGCYAVAAGAARLLRLDLERATQAVAIAGTAFNALRVTRTGLLSHWKGLAYPNAAFCALHATYLAAAGITGPEQVFEGNKGFMHSIAGPFEIDWRRERLDRVERSILKRYNAEIHSQSTLEALSDLRDEHGLRAHDVESVEVSTFDVAHKIIGGGEEGDKTRVTTKEQADHSLPYMCAVMLLDGEVTPRQYEPDRLSSEAVQSLLRRVHVRPDAALSRRFPEELPSRVSVVLRDGRRYMKEKRWYRGFHREPMSWEDVGRKFHALAAGDSRVSPDQRETSAGAAPQASEVTRAAILETVAGLEQRATAELTALLARVGEDERTTEIHHGTARVLLHPTEPPGRQTSPAGPHGDSRPLLHGHGQPLPQRRPGDDG
jgi:2-methylcitrate dehydratase